ncbi:hypothetical protein A1O3_01477 [Capronia epimyces CBS 606.96]|uniref:Aminoglycoside phosphotransferase domain-containing protein n=1 Tax=Capronia epimyces CBS 606.96 TaxID=1182542 RepID=W9YUJ7_9EURO|nr:uncharacterized protein A1O3_01477 [Capronia epimyces CBS 606.96]EXJ92921.1 hypothetical protein A1O3_01477 [Capronia epimyces CBS 606.96]
MPPMQRRQSVPATADVAAVISPKFAVSIPYYAPAAALPAALPTTAEIKRSVEVLSQRSTAKVVTVGSHFVAKYGRLNLEEGRMMIFVQQHSQVPVLRVFALYRDDEEETSYIVMERIHGQTLKVIWDTLDDQQNIVITTQLREYIGQLRRIESPCGYCGLDKTPLPTYILWTPI